METEACVFHIDIDAFFASVEQLRNPRLAGRPVVVGAGVIASASYEARRFGLSAGMPLAEARRRCPGLVILEGHYPIYRCFAEQVFDVCRIYAPAMECHLDEAFCDLSGTQRLYGFGARPGKADELPRVALELWKRIQDEVGLSVSLGIGRSRMIAKMASKSAKPRGLRWVQPSEEDAFLRPLPVRLLPGVGPRTASVLDKLNIQTIEEMRLLSRDSLRAMFGQNGVLLHERCRGEDTRAIGAREIPRSISRETSFHRDAIATDEIEGMLHYLTERAANAMRKLGLKARTVEVKLRSTDFQDEVGARTLRTPTQIDSEIFEVVMALRRSLQKRRVALHLVGVTLSRFVPDDGTRAVELWSTVFSPPVPPEGAVRELPCHGAPLPRGGAVSSPPGPPEGAVCAAASQGRPPLRSPEGAVCVSASQGRPPLRSPEGAVCVSASQGRPPGPPEGAVALSRSGAASASEGAVDLFAALEEAMRKTRGALSLCRSLDRIRERFGYSSVVSGKSLNLLGKLPQDAYGYVLRTPSLTR
jgi:DNA polymerase-4